MHTALHGVGDATLRAVLASAGWPAPVPVAAQQHPDPAFPTVPYPNPEEPGVLDLAAATAEREGADLVLANDPDADRLAVMVPGPEGWRMLTGDELDVPYDFNSLAQAGTMLGSGAIIVVDDSTPIIDVALKVAKFYRHESCGKCTPCREGTNWTVKMLERIDAGEATPMDLDIMSSVQEHIMGNCLCVLGDAMAMPIASMITKFRDEFEAHMESRRLEAVGA